jgi:hypothetical protein
MNRSSTVEIGALIGAGLELVRHWLELGSYFRKVLL